MNDRQKEIMYVCLGVGLCVLVLGNSVRLTYFSQIERNVEFRVFETDYWDVNNKKETLVLTNGSGKYIFLGNWTGQFIEGSTYNVTYVQKQGSTQRWYKDLIVIDWREIH